MLVIKLELVIKIKKRENMKTEAYSQEVKGPGNERPGREREGWTKGLKRKQSKIKTEKRERY